MPSAAYALAALERISLPPIGGDIAVMVGHAARYAPPTEYLEHPLGSPPSKKFPLLVIAIALLLAVAAVVWIGLY